MSLASSRSPETDYMLNSQYQQNKNNYFQNDQKPIIKLMRQQNSYLLNQNPQTPARPQSHLSPSSQLTNLKQFQRSLQKQRPSEVQTPNNFYSTIKKTSPSHSPKATIKQKFVTSLMINEQTMIQPNQYQQQIAFQHRVKQTQKYGNANLQKIKKLIVDQKPLKFPRSLRKKKTEPYPYDGTSSIDKLHSTYIKTSSSRRDLYIKKFYGQEMRQVKPFKIDNPISQFMIDKRAEKQGPNHKPLYERSVELAKQLSQARLEKQIQKVQQAMQKQQQQAIKFEQLRKQKYPDSATKQRQQQFYNEMIKKQKQKNQLKQQQKIQHLRQINKQKPYVTKASKQIFSKIVQKKQMSRDFLQRNYQYRAEREKQKLKQMQKHDQEYCPFAPRISEASRQKAQKYYERKEKKLSSKQQQKDLVLQKDQLQKKLKQIQLRIKEKKHTAQQNLKNLNQHKRAASAHPLGQNNMIATKSKQNLKGNKTSRQVNQFRKVQQNKEEEIPIYNRIDYGKSRTNSCFNLKCKRGNLS